MELYYIVAEFNYSDVESYFCVVILYYNVVGFNYCDVVLHSPDVTLKTNEKAHRKGKCTFCILPSAFARENTKRAFPCPLFALAKKRINFPHLSCIFTNTLTKKHSI